MEEEGEEEEEVRKVEKEKEEGERTCQFSRFSCLQMPTFYLLFTKQRR